MRTTRKVYNNINSSIFYSGSPSVADASNYFYLPALGGYIIDIISGIGSAGQYWSSSTDPWNSYYAYYLQFDSGRIYVSANAFRNMGFRVEPSFE